MAFRETSRNLEREAQRRRKQAPSRDFRLVQATGGHHVPLMVFTFVAFLQCVVAVVVGRPSKM